MACEGIMIRLHVSQGVITYGSRVALEKFDLLIKFDIVTTKRVYFTLEN